MLYFIIPVVLFAIIVTVNFFSHLFNDRIYSRPEIFIITELWTILLAPGFFLHSFDIGKGNDCCSDSAVFAPFNKTGIYLVICLCIAAYFYSSIREKLSTPIVELLLNAALIVGVFLNIFIAIHIHTQEFGGLFWLLGNVPIIMLFIIIMKENMDLLKSAVEEGLVVPQNALSAISLNILQSNAWIRFPLLALFALPLLLILSLVLFLFGQKPDTLIRAFTDTYKHGFSQLDYMCDNIQCGGHFLCSVAAKGHRTIVQPERYGERNGHKIICNRQLLIANAFEDLLQERFPLVHKGIRREYNKVGTLVHRYYHVFNNKFVADFVYVVMKPFEWFFLLVLYTFDTRPENRIAKQYLSITDRIKIQQLQQQKSNK
jgi:hypothetical protein